jgi:hypothetical protein
MVFSLQHDIKVTKSHQNLLPTQSVIVVHTVENSTLKNEFEYWKFFGVSDNNTLKY